MKKLLLFLVLSIGITISRADSIISVQDTLTTEVKANLAANALAKGVGIPVDSFKTGADFVNAGISLYNAEQEAKSAKGTQSYLLWGSFVVLLLGFILACWNWYLHNKNNLTVNKILDTLIQQGKTVSIILLFLCIGLAGSGCKTTFVHTQDGNIVGKTPIGKQGYDLQYLIAFHTIPGQNDTASLTLYGPDSVTNNLINDFKNYVQKKFPMGK